MTDGVSASMFKKLKDFLIGRKAGDITPAEAHKIQKRRTLWRIRR